MPVAARSARGLRRTAWCAAALLALTAAGAGLAATALATAPPKPGPANSFDNALIARTALGYVGRWGGQACVDARHDASGQCKQFVNCVVALASGKHVYPVDPHGDYQNSYPDAGGIEVTGAAATTGDIIQVGEHDTDHVLHTAIITATGPDGTFTVVDANWVGVPGTPELVGVHDYTPPRTARFWRLGSLGTKPATRTAAAQAGANPAGTPSQTPATATIPPSPPVVSTTADARIATGIVAFSVTATGSSGTNAAEGSRPDPVVAIRLYLDQLPYTTQPAASGTTVLKLDTGNVPDGFHHLSAQAISATGAISPLSAPLALTVANTTFAVAATAPATPLVSGVVPLMMTASTPGPLTAVTWKIDGRPVPAKNTTIGKPWDTDTSTLTPGGHDVTVTATDSHGHTATSTPVPITVAAAATGNRVTLDATGSGTTDLIGTDSAGRLLRYPGAGDGRFGIPTALWPDRSSGAVRTLAGGHFTADHSRAQLIATWADHTAHLYTFDNTGHLTGGTPITGPDWSTYTRLVAGDFTATGSTGLLGSTTDGHAELITLAGDGHTATTTPTPGIPTAPSADKTTAVLAADTAGTGSDDLLTIDGAGTVNAQTYLPGTGFGPAQPLGTVAVPAAGTIPVAGNFTTGGPHQILTTTVDGTTLIQQLTAETNPQPPRTATFGQITTPPPTRPGTIAHRQMLVAWLRHFIEELPAADRDITAAGPHQCVEICPSMWKPGHTRRLGPNGLHLIYTPDGWPSGR